MRKITIALLAIIVFTCISVKAQQVFPIDSITARVSFSIKEQMNLPRAELYNKVKEWFQQYYKSNSFEDRYKITRKGKPLHLKEDKEASSITGKCGFIIRYPKDRSGLVMEHTFVSYTLKVHSSDSAFTLQLTDFICYTANTVQNDMRPPEYGLEVYNERRLNDMDYVQDHVIPQVLKGIRATRDELLRFLQPKKLGILR